MNLESIPTRSLCTLRGVCDSVDEKYRWLEARDFPRVSDGDPKTNEMIRSFFETASARLPEGLTRDQYVSKIISTAEQSASLGHMVDRELQMRDRRDELIQGMITTAETVSSGDAWIRARLQVIAMIDTELIPEELDNAPQIAIAYAIAVRKFIEW